jgi:phosphoribosylformylglycinamidine synthase
MSKKVNSIIIRVAGTNCDIETCYALKLAGSDTVDLVHINQIIRKEVKLSKYQIMAIPGGFSYGDDVSAGKIFTVQLQYKLWNEIEKFDLSGRLIIGICNGFQVLVKLGLLPGLNSEEKIFTKDDLSKNQINQTVTLTNNNSGKFECRWVYLKPGKNNLWTKDMPDIIQLPIAHAEGKFMTKDKKTLKLIEQNNQVAFRYVDEQGNVVNEFPYNPNGSQNNIAGITNKRGNILGLMPHPERYVLKYQHPFWTRYKSLRIKANNQLENYGDGLFIFQNAVKYSLENLT